MVTVSVIVPVYNAEKTLNQCVDSILCQTFKDFELILVNDGSADNCAEICNTYIQMHSCVKVIHKVNEGVSAARNDGMALACGKYIMFIDADDFVSEDCLAVLVDGMKDDCDFVCAAKVSIFNDRQIPEQKQAFDLDLTKEIGSDYYDKLAGFTSPWMKLFKRDIIMEQNIRFNPTIHYGEDTAFVYEYLYHCNRIKQVPNHVYYYRVYDGSAARRFQKGISGSLAYRQARFERFINKLHFVDPINDIIIEGFACIGFCLLVRNVLCGAPKAAIEEIRLGQAKFKPYIDRLYNRICCKEDISVSGIPKAFHKEIKTIANTNNPKRIYMYTAYNVRKAAAISKMKATVKRKLFGK